MINFTKLSALRLPVKRALSAAAVAACLLPSLKAGAQFTQGNVVVLQVGDGSAALSNASTALFLKEYNTTSANQSSSVTTVTIPTTGGNKLMQSGSATSEGQITLSADSTKIVIVGYDTTAGIASIASSTSANAPRAIDTVGVSGVAGRAASSNSIYSANNFRSAVRSNADNFWGAGGNGGTYYFGNTTTAGLVQTTVTNGRVINIYNGNLYVSSGASATLGLYKVTGLPTTTGNTATVLIATGTGSSPYAFAINSSETIVYIADDRSAASGGGIQKWVYTAGSWGTTPAYTIPLGVTTAGGARGLAVDFSGTTPVLYATTTDNRLVKVVDSNSTAAYTTLATAVTNTAFRSVVFAPKAACTAPLLSAAATNITCSSNGAVNLTVTGGSAVSSYSWTGPSSFTASTQNISGLTTAGTYNVTVTTTGGCTATASAVIANNASFTATITPPANTVLCPNDSITLQVTSGTGYTYVWKLNGNPITGAANATYKAGAAGAYTATVTNGLCASTSAAVTLTANTVPALATAVVNITCSQNGSVTLTTTGGTTPFTYAWTGPSSFTAGTQNISGLTNAGTYNVTVTTPGGCSATTNASVTSSSTLTATITPPANTVLCPNDSIILHVTNGTGYTYVWKLNGNPITGATDSTYKAGAAGAYTATVTNGLCASTSAAVTLTANTLPALATAVVNITCSQNGSVTLTTTGGTTPFTYAWTGPSSFTAGTQNISGLTNAGTYNVTVTTPGGCSATTSAAVTASSTLTATITAGGATTLCQGDSVLLNANTGTGYTYQWKQNTNPITGATNATYKAGASGSYTVTITNGSCTGTSNAITVTVNPLPVAVFTVSNASLCQGDTAILHATTATGYTYQWKLNGSPLPGATDSMYKTGTAGVYTLTVAKNGCTATSTSVTIAVHALPATAVTVTGATTFCDGDSVKLKAVSIAGGTYQWQKNGIVVSGATDSVYTATVGGNYAVKMTSSFGCTDTSVVTTVTVNPLPVPVITNTNNTLSTATFTTYQWFLNGVAVSGATNQTYVPTANGSYTVFVTDGNTCGDTSAAIALTHVGITEPNTVAVQIYPNPVNDVLAIDAPMPVNALVKDIQGRAVLQVSNAQRISMGNLPDGMYFLTLSDKTGTIIKTEKISKQSR